MKTVYIRLLDALLGPLCGLADDDEFVTQYDSLDPNSERDVKEVLTTTLLPNYQRMAAAKQIAGKVALAYALSTPGFPFGRVFDSCLIPFDHPSDSKLFFVWLWNVLFSPEYPDFDLNAPYILDYRPEVTYRFPPYEP